MTCGIGICTFQVVLILCSIGLWLATAIVSNLFMGEMTHYCKVWDEEAIVLVPGSLLKSDGGGLINADECRLHLTSTGANPIPFDPTESKFLTSPSSTTRINKAQLDWPTQLTVCKENQRAAASFAALLFWIAAPLMGVWSLISKYWYYVWDYDQDPNYDDSQDPGDGGGIPITKGMRRYLMIPLYISFSISTVSSWLYVALVHQMVDNPTEDCPGVIELEHSYGFRIMCAWIAHSAILVLYFLISRVVARLSDPTNEAVHWFPTRNFFEDGSGRSGRLIDVTQVLVFIGLPVAFIVTAVLSNLNMVEVDFSCSDRISGEVSGLSSSGVTYGPSSVGSQSNVVNQINGPANCSMTLGTISNTSVGKRGYTVDVRVLFVVDSKPTSSSYDYRLLNCSNSTSLLTVAQVSGLLFWVIPLATFIVFFPTFVVATWVWIGTTRPYAALKAAMYLGFFLHLVAAFLQIIFSSLFIRFLRQGGECPGFLRARYGYGWWCQLLYLPIVVLGFPVFFKYLAIPCSDEDDESGQAATATAGTQGNVVVPPVVVPAQQLHNDPVMNNLLNETNKLEAEVANARERVSAYEERFLAAAAAESVKLSEQEENRRRQQMEEMRESPRPRQPVIDKKFFAELAEVMECPICFSMYGENDSAVPVTFSCGHSCCAEHVGLLRGKCPKCRAPIVSQPKPAIALKSAGKLIIKLRDAAEEAERAAAISKNEPLADNLSNGEGEGDVKLARETSEYPAFNNPALRAFSEVLVFDDDHSQDEYPPVVGAVPDPGTSTTSSRGSPGATATTSTGGGGGGRRGMVGLIRNLRTEGEIRRRARPPPTTRPPPGSANRD